jgi:hypothetical protein
MASTLPSHLVHDELGTPSSLSDDCRAVGANLRLDRVAAVALTEPPSIHFEDFPSEIRKPEITYSDAAVRLASALHLHLD